MSDYGFVYVMHNFAMNGVYKIGFTTRSVFKRAEELSAGTGVADDYSPAYYLETSAVRELEYMVHADLVDYRINPAREFFRCPLSMAIWSIRKNTEDGLAEYISDMALEALNPGQVDPHSPLWFESSLYHPDQIAAFSQGEPRTNPRTKLFQIDVLGGQ